MKALCCAEMGINDICMKTVALCIGWDGMPRFGRDGLGELGGGRF